jgi:hypothetical protein
MSDHFFDADRASGEYPPKGWGWKDRDQQRKALANHFWRINSQIDQWMIGEAERLNIPLPTRTLDDADIYMPIVYGTVSRS